MSGKDGIPVIPDVGRVIGNVDVGRVIVGMPDTCGIEESVGRPGDCIMPSVGNAAGTAPPGTEVVADGIDGIPSDGSARFTVVGNATGAMVAGTDATGAGCCCCCCCCWGTTGDISSTGMRWR